MGIGDQIIATGLARGAKARGKRIAFGDGRRIIWDHQSEMIFRDNPNIAPPGSEGALDIEWIPYYKGHRIYNKQDAGRHRWIWNENFRPQPGEVFLSDQEKKDALRCGTDFIVMEPNIETWKSVAPNKDWGHAKYQELANLLRADGHQLKQFHYPKSGPSLKGVASVSTKSFRDAMAIMANASMYVGAEGGLHHVAAAVGIPAVVLFGGFVSPKSTGYEAHTNLTGAAEACGSLGKCDHCIAAMAAISVQEVLEACRRYL